MDPRAELASLLAGLLDGPEDAERASRLRALLRAHPDLHDAYLGHLRLHAMLHWRSGAAAAAPPARRRWRAWAVSAAALLAVAAAWFLLVARPEARAAPDVVERVADWNLSLSEATRSGERRELYESQVGPLTALLESASIPAQERELALSLLENGSWLASNDDPMTAAKRFSDIADQFVARIDALTDDDPARAASLADMYDRLNDTGVSANLERGIAASAKDPHRQSKLDRARAGIARRNKRLAELLQRTPEPSRKAISRALHGHGRKKKHHRPGK